MVYILISFLIYEINFYSMPRVWTFSYKTMIHLGFIITITSSLLHVLIISLLLIITQLLLILWALSPFEIIIARDLSDSWPFCLFIFLIHKDLILRFIIVIFFISCFHLFFFTFISTIFFFDLILKILISEWNAYFLNCHLIMKMSKIAIAPWALICLHLI